MPRGRPANENKAWTQRQNNQLTYWREEEIASWAQIGIDLRRSVGSVKTQYAYLRPDLTGPYFEWALKEDRDLLEMWLDNLDDDTISMPGRSKRQVKKRRQWLTGSKDERELYREMLRERGTRED